ncbi:MAG: hypothetical protein R3B89_12860 [Polyangiaceae bacterium]
MNAALGWISLPQGTAPSLFLGALVAALLTLLSPASFASDALTVRISGEPAQVLALHRALSHQLLVDVRSKRIPESDLTARASQGGGERLTVWIDLSDPRTSRVIFTRHGEVVGERKVGRNGASDDVHFEELALAVRSAVEALAREPEPAPSEPEPAATVAGAESPGKTTTRAGAAPLADTSPGPSTPQRTPYRLDFEPTYAATTYAQDPNVLFGLGLGFEGVAQSLAANPGIRLSTDTTVAFEFTDSRPRVAHLRGLFTLGIERWLPARWGIGVTGERDPGQRRPAYGIPVPGRNADG